MAPIYKREIAIIGCGLHLEPAGKDSGSTFTLNVHLEPSSEARSWPEKMWVPRDIFEQYSSGRKNLKLRAKSILNSYTREEIGLRIQSELDSWSQAADGQSTFVGTLKSNA
jgi:hypothetical protein